jgi:hypothetical protein
MGAQTQTMIGMACLVILLIGEDQTAGGNAATVAAASIASRRCGASEEAGERERARGADLRRGRVGWEWQESSGSWRTKRDGVATAGRRRRERGKEWGSRRWG